MTQSNGPAQSTAANATSTTKPYAARPDAIDWQRVDDSGTRSATFNGTRDAGQTFTYAFHIPAGFWDRPHSHSGAARVFVATGELRIGYGNELEPSEALSYPAGSYLYVPAGAVHFDGADIDTTIYGVSTGPWSTDYVDEA